MSFRLVSKSVTLNDVERCTFVSAVRLSSVLEVVLLLEEERRNCRCTALFH